MPLIAAPGLAAAAAVAVAVAADGAASMAEEAMQGATSRLLNTLLVTFLSVFLGFASVRLKLFSPEKGETKALGVLVGQIVFPLLIFKTVATARLGDVNWGVLIACTIGKVAVMAVTWAATFCFYHRSETRGQRFLNAVVFTSFVMASNDFAVGLPVVDALYGAKANMGIYINGNALVGSLFFVPTIMVLFAVGGALKKKDNPVMSAEPSENAGGSRLCVTILRDILTNPVIVMTLAGLAYKGLLGQTLVDNGQLLNFPHPLSDAIDLVISPFAMCALFLTGTSLKTLQLALVPTLLVLMKVVVCAFLTYAVGMSFLGDRILENFCFLYGMIPTSSAPIVFAATFAPDSRELLATGILMGLLVAGPLMFCTAIFLESKNIDMTATLIDVQFTTNAVGLTLSILAVAIVLLLGRDFMYRCSLKALVALYSLVLFVYEALLFSVRPELNKHYCVAHNESEGRDVMSFFIGWAGALGQLLTFTMMLFMIIGLRRRHTAAVEGCPEDEGGLKNALWALLGCSLLAVAPAFGTHPSTITEMCAEVEPKIGAISLTGNLIWVGVSFAATVVLYVVHRRSPYMRLLLPPPVQEATVDAVDAADVAGSSLLTADPVQAWKSAVPVDIVSGLFIMQALRLVLQLVNTLQVSSGHGKITESFAVMLVLEQAVVMLQPVVFVVVLCSSPTFTAHLVAVFPRRCACFAYVRGSGRSPASAFIRGEVHTWALCGAPDTSFIVRDEERRSFAATQEVPTDGSAGAMPRPDALARVQESPVAFQGGAGLGSQEMFTQGARAA